MHETDTKANQSLDDTEPQVQNEEAAKFKVRHNKQTVELTLEELLSAAEKGLDYDRIRPSHDYVKHLAAKKGETDISRFLKESETKQAENNDGIGNQSKNMDQKLHAEYPEAFTDILPERVEALVKGGMNTLEAFRLFDIERTRSQRDDFKARYEAELANRSNAEATMGSLQGGDAVEKDYYSSREWDKLAQGTKEKFIKNGKIYEFMKKWNQNEK